MSGLVGGQRRAGVGRLPGPPRNGMGKCQRRYPSAKIPGEAGCGPRGRAPGAGDAVFLAGHPRPRPPTPGPVPPGAALSRQPRAHPPAGPARPPRPPPQPPTWREGTGPRSPRSRRRAALPAGPPGAAFAFGSAPAAAAREGGREGRRDGGMEGGREAPLRPGEGEVSPRAVAACPPTPRESFFRVLLGRVFFVFVFGFNFTHTHPPPAAQPRLTSQRSRGPRRGPPASRRVRDHLPGLGRGFLPFALVQTQNSQREADWVQPGLPASAPLDLL